MPVFEAPAVYVQSAFTTLSTYMIQHMYLKEYIDLHSTDANFIPLSCPTKALYIRRDNIRKQTIVNVFDHMGNKIYTFERESSLNPVWSLLTYPNRIEVATVRAGFFHTSFDFHNKSSLQHRVIKDESGLAGKLKTFHLTDGYKYGWTRGTKYLEKFTNPDGSDEEVRERIAKVRLMRQWKFDFEMILDENKVDLEIALATGFISMMTQWGVGDITETVGPTVIPYTKKEPIKQIEESTNSKNVTAPRITVVMNGNEDADFIVEQGKNLPFIQLRN